MDQLKMIRSAQEDSEQVHQKLRDYNAQFMGDGKDYNFHIEENGRIIAGIVAASVFDTLEVDFLFVDADYRGKGLGKTLLRHVEDQARRDGLKRIILNTYSFQAPNFYQKLGYLVAAELTPCFGTVSQYFLCKELS